MLTKFSRRLGKHVAQGLLAQWQVSGGLHLYIADLLRDLGRERPLNDPLAALRLLHQSLEPAHFDTVVLKRPTSDALTAARFGRFLEALDRLAPVPEATARRCARIADDFRGNLEGSSHPGADVAWHFDRLSCNMLKGRVMTAAVRLMRPNRCIEVGTAYGFSAAVILSALERVSPDGRLLTIEISEIQHRLASAVLGGLFGPRVECRRGDAGEVLGPAAAAMAPVDFVFHDARHSKVDYVRDFGAVVDSLASGGAVLFDDIRWTSRDDPSAQPRCYEGWRRVVDHPMVQAAVEIGPTVGMVMVS